MVDSLKLLDYHRFTMHYVGLFICFCSSVFMASAAKDSLSTPTDTMVTTVPTGTLHLNVASRSFFINNEFGGNIAKGYTLPGFWLQPRLTYQATPMVKMELGAHALVYHGANKYPNYAYHDLALWKGSQYQEGAHLLPFFRVTAQLGQQHTLVLGNLYGSTQHQLITPMYNSELQFSADPEKGLQYLFRGQRYQLDLWVDWESFIFDKVAHQEAFTFGLAQRLGLLGKPQGAFFLEMPLQILAQHRGGEQDITDLGVQTLSNASLGLMAHWKRPTHFLGRLSAEGHVLWAYQQAGKLWPFQQGRAWWLGLNTALLPQLQLQLGYFSARNYVALYGAPLFSTISLKEDGGRFSSMNTIYYDLSYAKSLGKTSSLGAFFRGYVSQAGTLHLKDGKHHGAQWSNSISMGVFLRINTDFGLKKY